MDSARFWYSLDTLVTTCEVVIDRPRGSTHPRYPSFTYPLDYGYLRGSRAADGGGIDIWIGSLTEKAVTGVVLAIDLVKRDSEMKILLGCTRGEIATVLLIHNSGSQSAILLEREGM